MNKKLIFAILSFILIGLTIVILSNSQSLYYSWIIVNKHRDYTIF